MGFFNRAVLFAQTGAVALTATSAMAQGTVLEEIFVTAQKREQGLQDVPISVTALSAGSLETKAVTNIAQVAAFAPNVTIDNTSPFGGSSQILSASIRGIGQNDFSSNFEPGVGVYIDGVYFARSVGAVVDLLDLERVEVLKGPQGTLFGRNTIGGALNVVTRDPAEAFGYKFEATLGRFERTDFRGSIDIPISDTVQTVAAFSYKNRNGFQKILSYQDPVLGRSFVSDQGSFPQIPQAAGQSNVFDSRGGEDVFNARIKAKWEMSDRVTLRVSADYTREDVAGVNSALLSTNAAAGLDDLGAGIGFDATSGNPTIASIYNTCINTPVQVLAGLAAMNPMQFGPLDPVNGLCGPRSTVGSALAGANAGGPGIGPRLTWGDVFITDDIDTTFANGVNFAELDAFGISATFDWEISDSLDFKSITAYRNTEFAGGMDIDGSPIDLAATTQTIDQKQFSQELQLNGLSFDDRLNWVVGLYFFDESVFEESSLSAGEGLIQILSPTDIDNQAYAAFGHANFAITEAFGVTVGVRYSYEDKRNFVQQRERNLLALKQGIPPTLFPDPSDLELLFPPVPVDLSFENIDLKFGLEYKVAPDILTYASYSEGFKSGGVTNRLTLPVPCSNPGPGVPADQCVSFDDGVVIPGVISLIGLDDLKFDEEQAKSYEIGLKSKLFDNRLRLNVAAFFVDYTDLQVIAQQGVSPVTTNAGDAEAYGFEIDFQAIATDTLSFDGGIGLTQAKYTRFNPPVGFVNLIPDGGQLINTPKWNINLGSTFLVPLNNDSEVQFRLDYIYNSQIANDVPNTPELIAPDTHVLNANIAYRAPDDQWSLTFGVTNLTDERFVVSGIRQDTLGLVDGVFSRPREWFLTFRING